MELSWDLSVILLISNLIPRVRKQILNNLNPFNHIGTCVLVQGIVCIAKRSVWTLKTMKRMWAIKCFNIFYYPRSFWVSSVIQMFLESAVKMDIYSTSSVLWPKLIPLCWEKAFCCSVTHSCLILCDPMDCRMPGLPVIIS